MLTSWGEALNKNNVLAEYPRPQMVRGGYVNLNGEWDYAFTIDGVEPSEWDGKILVPFSPECELSGVQRILKPGEYLWYHREFTLPEHKGRVILHFGAVDQICTVYLNNVEICSHVGGYLPFECDITSALSDVNRLVVAVMDDSDTSYHSRGKQKFKRGGIWYTPQSGIWQTVWCECVPEDYIKNLHITPDFDSASVQISAETVGNSAACAIFEGKEYPLPAVIPVPDFEAWTPDNPKLYDFSVVCGEDRVDSYFAMRKFSVEKGSDGIKRLFLNGAPLFHNGMLDQGYWSDGMYTAPSDEAMIFDIQTAKDMGFNMLRKHIKVEPLRWYYHCDRLGMLVWQDMINGGGSYNPAIISTPLVTGVHLKDNHYRLFAREEAEGRIQYEVELRQMIKHLYNCPCIAMWVPFNEGWGQFDSEKMCGIIRKLDSTRTIDHASGWHDQKIGDIKSLHVYFKKYVHRQDKLGRAVLLTEFGGYNYYCEGHCFGKRDFGYRKLKSIEELTEALRILYSEQIKPAYEQGLAAAVYTQVSDVEDEVNGLITYDRRVVKIKPEIMRGIISVDK
ncbi:MAG: glycoside hydrolase family 2 TIM barrel-domain containing protein [Bacillota bacterium]|nr:glycoside hydrolase family 2 TIM barrel-domain containing protein [Bacillota bacterium]